MTKVSSVIRAPIVAKIIEGFFADSSVDMGAVQVAHLTESILISLEEVGEIKNVILSELLYQGDRVVKNVTGEEAHYDRSGVPNGTIGTICGVYRYLDYHPRYGGGGDKSGVYETDGVRYVEWDNFVPPEGTDPDVYRRAQPNEVALLDQVLQRERYQKDWVDSPLSYEDRNIAMKHIVRVGDLPETKLYEKDLVRINHPHFKRQTGVVHHIHYHLINRGGLDDRGMSYDIELTEGGSTWLHDVDLELIERGNVWKHYHNEPLSFTTLEEELRFHSGMGWTEQLRNPATGNYSWAKDEVLEAIRVGDAHAFQLVGGFFGGNKMDAAFRINDPDLAERVRLKTLEGFGLRPA